MQERMYVDVNVIQTVPPSCVNRDDTGSPKTATYGGVRRARVSSQSWKRAMRQYFRERFDEQELGVRTTRVVELIADRIVALDPSVGKDEAIKMAQKALQTAGVSTDVKKDKKGEAKTDYPYPQTPALFFISVKQTENLARLALGGEYDKKAAVKALNSGNGVDVALFGRMLADDPSLNTDAACQVAHSISTHRVENEYDYYTAIDDLAPEDNAGATMIGTVEFNSSTLYRYATLAVHDLAGLLDSKEATAKAAEEFVRAFVLSMPTGRQNTFANRTVPYAVFIAVRGDQPVSLVSAFEHPVLPDRDGGGYNVASVKRLVDYEQEACSSFVAAPLATWQVGEGLDGLGPRSELASALEGLRQFILKEN